MPPRELYVVILAAGLGTRMKSETAKVLHRVAGRPLVLWPVELARSLEARRILCVLGHQLDAVRDVLEARAQGATTVVEQREPRGTGDAVRQALPALADAADDACVVILYGDVPLLQRDTVARLVEEQASAGAPLALVTTRPPSPAGYGRVIRDGASRIQRIVEDRDAIPEEKLIDEVNAGIYAVRLGFLREGVAGLQAQNAQGELYLTDLVQLAALGDVPVPSVAAPFEDVSGVNDRIDLARIDAAARRRVAERWMREGVTITAPETVSIDVDGVELARDVTLGQGVALRGRVRVEPGARIDVGCVITDSTIGAGANVKPYSVLTETVVGARAQVGPFAHCRPGTALDDDVHLGNFVETKKAHLGPGAKANHLAYLGDAEIGAKVNVGAGTITCNYDGVNKHRTVIEDGAFIGSDTQLVAPVRVGRGAYVAAGTTVTKDVPPDALAITRAEQRTIEGYARRRRARKT